MPGHYGKKKMAQNGQGRLTDMANAAKKRVASAVKKEVDKVKKAASNAGIKIPKNVISRHINPPKVSSIRSPAGLMNVAGQTGVKSALEKVGLGKQSARMHREFDSKRRDFPMHRNPIGKGAKPLTAAQSKKLLSNIPKSDSEIRGKGLSSSDVGGLSGVLFQSGNPKAGKVMPEICEYKSIHIVPSIA